MFIFLDHRPKYANSIDWLGLFHLGVHFVMLSSCFVLPIVGVLSNSDPFGHIFDLFGERQSESLKLVIFIARFLLMIACLYEFSRYGTLICFVFFSIVFTISTCLRKVIRDFMAPDEVSFKLYNHLCIVIRQTEYFTSHLFAVLLVISQILMVSLWWFLVKCWNLITIYITMLFGVVAMGTLFTTVIIIVPYAVEISEASKKFLETKKAKHHTFNRRSKKYYCFCKWSSRQMLPMRFGSRFVMSVKTPINFLNVLMTNLANATLLINP